LVRIDELAQLLKKTKSQIAREVGITPSALGDWKGGRSNPPVKILIKIYDLYHISLNWFVLGLGNPFIENCGELKRTIQELKKDNHSLEEKVAELYKQMGKEEERKKILEMMEKYFKKHK